MNSPLPTHERRPLLPGVLSLVDTLQLGGAERMAVNLANLLPRHRYRAYLATTRSEGPLAEMTVADVGRLSLNRRRRFDLMALQRLAAFIGAHDIRIIHAHGTALFVAVQASLLAPYPHIVWHDHFGRYATEERPVWIYRLLTRRVSGVIAVNQPLVEWARQRLGLPAERVRYIANFVPDPPAGAVRADLPGSPGKRIVCVANLRPEKDHLNLVRAMALVTRQVPDAQLLLVGGMNNQACRALLEAEISAAGLWQNVFLLGEQRDIPAILRACDIGVLGSASEGLPLALIEYGKAGLPAVATRVGQCAEVLEEGRAGLLVAPRQPAALAAALISLLNSSEQRAALGAAFQQRVNQLYSPAAALEQISQIYEQVMARGAVTK